MARRKKNTLQVDYQDSKVQTKVLEYVVRNKKLLTEARFYLSERIRAFLESIVRDSPLGCDEEDIPEAIMTADECRDAAEVLADEINQWVEENFEIPRNTIGQWVLEQLTEYFIAQGKVRID